MKKKTVVATLLALVLMLCAGSAMAATGYCRDCNSEQEGTWIYDNETYHFFSCSNCGGETDSFHSFVENADSKYSAADATCEKAATYFKSCSLCGFVNKSATFEYGEPLGHQWIKTNAIWSGNYDSCTRTYVCERNSEHTKEESTTTITSSGATHPSCVEVSSVEMYAWFSEQDFEKNEILFPPLGHHFGGYVYNNDATCEKDGTETATCRNLGCEQQITQTAEGTKLGHNYKLTSTENGDKTYTCKYCGKHYTEKHSHDYGEWTGDENGQQTAECKIDGCEHVGKSDCEFFEFTLNDETFTLCPVCGAISNGERLALAENAEAEADALPEGELVLRMNGEFMSIGFEFAGRLTQPTEPVTITLPAEAVEGYALTVLAADGTETPLETTANGETVQFTVDFGEAKVVPIHMVAAK